MFHRGSFAITLAATVLALVCHATPAAAQLYAAAFLGGNYTMAADVVVEQPGRNTNLRYRDVTFSARPLQSPQYYGLRIGRIFGETRRHGLEVEFIHLKVISNTAESFRLTGELEGASGFADTPVTMNGLVQRYSMTHGLNFLVFNAVMHRPLGGRLAFVGRAGAGPTFPHAETTVRQVGREQYEYAGMGVQLGAGFDVRLKRWLSGQVEYKFTAASPTIHVNEGTGHMVAATHQIAAGLAFGLSR